MQINDYYEIETITWYHIIIIIREKDLKLNNCGKISQERTTQNM